MKCWSIDFKFIFLFRMSVLYTFVMCSAVTLMVGLNVNDSDSLGFDCSVFQTIVVGWWPGLWLSPCTQKL